MVLVIKGYYCHLMDIGELQAVKGKVLQCSVAVQTDEDDVETMMKTTAGDDVESSDTSTQTLANNLLTRWR